MKKIIYFEFKKMFFNRFFGIAIIIVICLNLIMLWQEQRTDPSSIPSKAYKELTTDLQRMGIEEQWEYLTYRYSQVSDMIQLEHWIDDARYAEFNDRRSYAFARIKEINEKWPGVYESGEYLVYTSNLEQEYLLISEVYAECAEVYHYSNYLEKVRGNADRLAGVSIFNDENSYEYKATQIAVAAFDEMDSTAINYSPQVGIHKATNYYLSDVLLVISMIIVSFIVARQERDQGLLNLVRSTKKGRAETAFAKLVVFGLGMYILTLLLYSVNIMFYSQQYGLGNLDRSIQSIPELMGSTLKINVWQYLLLYIHTKWISSFVLGISILLAVVTPKREYTGIILSVFFVAISFATSFFIPALSKWNILKYTNPVSLLNVNELLGNYRLLNLFGNPVSLVMISGIYLVVSVMVLSLTFCEVLRRGNLLPGAKSQSTYLIYKKTKTQKEKDRTCFVFELRKVLFEYGAIWILIIVAIFQTVQAMRIKPYIDSDEYYYRYYMKHLEGPYTQEKYEWLLEQQKKFEPIKTLQREHDKGTISDSEYGQAMQGLYLLQKEMNIFNRVVSNVSYSVDNECELVYDTGYRQFFGLTSTYENDRTLIISLALVLSISGIAANEYTNGTIKLIHNLPNGRDKIIKKKVLVCIAISGGLVISIFLIDLCHMFYYYGIGNIFAPLKSISDYYGFPRWISIFSWLIIQLLMKLVATISISILILTISQLTKNKTITMLIGIILFVAPVIIINLGFKFMEWLTICPIVSFCSYSIYTDAWIITIQLFLLFIYVLVGIYYLINYYIFDESKGVIT